MQRLENTIYHEEINPSIKTDSELIQILELADRNIKRVITFVFHMMKKLSGDMKDIKKAQLKLQKMNLIKHKMKNYSRWNL